MEFRWGRISSQGILALFCPGFVCLLSLVSLVACICFGKVWRNDRSLNLGLVDSYCFSSLAVCLSFHLLGLSRV